MRRYIFILMAMLICSYVFADNAQLRQQYYRATMQASSCDSLVVQLERATSSNTNKGYLGAAYMLAAKYKSNPYSKLKSFNQGKKMLDASISNDPGNLELRFLRLSIQENAPGILNYNQHIEEDRLTLNNKIGLIEDPELRD